MTHLEEGVRDTLSRLQAKYVEVKNSKDFGLYQYGEANALDLAIKFIETDLECWGEKK